MRRIRRIPGAIADRTRAAGARIAELVGRIVSPFKPAEGTTEGAVMLGLLLLAGAFVVGGHIDWALGVPGALLVLLGSGPFIASIRRRD
jgi:hypothetical protein